MDMMNEVKAQLTYGDIVIGKCGPDWEGMEGKYYAQVIKRGDNSLHAFGRDQMEALSNLLIAMHAE